MKFSTLTEEDLRKVATAKVTFKGVTFRFAFDRVVVEYRVKDPLEKGGMSGRAKTNHFQAEFRSMDELGYHFKMLSLKMDGKELPVGSCDVVRFHELHETFKKATSIIAYIGDIETFNTLSAKIKAESEG